MQTHLPIYKNKRVLISEKHENVFLNLLVLTLASNKEQLSLHIKTSEFYKSF